MSDYIVVQLITQPCLCGSTGGVRTVMLLCTFREPLPAPLRRSPFNLFLRDLRNACLFGANAKVV